MRFPEELRIYGIQRDAGKLFLHEDLLTDGLVDSASPRKCGSQKVKNVVMIVSRGLRTEIDSVKAIGLREVGGVDEESIVMNSDECVRQC